MTMFYSDADNRYLAAKAYSRAVEAQKIEREDAERRAKAAKLSAKQTPVKPDKHA